MPRPRDPAVDRAVHEAVLELVAARGLAGVTVEAVATRAGVARTTVYRRHDDVAALVGDAVDALLGMPAPDLSRDDRGAWAEVVESLRVGLFATRVGLPLLAALLVEHASHPELLGLWRTRVVAPRVAMIAERFGWDDQRARQLGELALGGLVAAFVAEGPVTPTRARALADLLWDALVARPAGRADG